MDNDRLFDQHKINIKIGEAVEVSQVPSKCKNQTHTHTHLLSIEAKSRQNRKDSVASLSAICVYHFPHTVNTPRQNLGLVFQTRLSCP